MLKSQTPILRFESERLQLKYVAKWFKAGVHNNNVSSKIKGAKMPNKIDLTN
jgi:hypothetical protein